MTSNRRLNVSSGESHKEPFTSALELLSRNLDAQTAAIFLTDPDFSFLDLITSTSRRKDFIRTTRRPLGEGILSGIIQRGLTVCEALRPELCMKLGLYAASGPELVYLAVPFGANGLLWIDREGIERFSPDQINLATIAAVMVADMVELYLEAIKSRHHAVDLELITSLTDGQDAPIETSGVRIDSIVSRMTQTRKCDGALVAISMEDGELCRIVSVSGFSGALSKGKVVRLRQGWAKWAIEKMRPAIISGLKGSETSLPIFHSGEAIGFSVKSLAVVPWHGFDAVDGILVAASRNAGLEWESSRPIWTFLASLIGLIRRLEISNKVLKSVKRYDGESGVMSEGFFRSQLRAGFDRQAAASGTFFVLLAQIRNLDNLYLDYDYTTINRFLGLFCEKLSMSTKRQSIAGKFSTGCFGIGVENVPATELDTLLKKASAMLGQGITNVDGVDIRHEVGFGWALFPHDSRSFLDLVNRASDKLLQNKSIGYP